MGGAYPQGRAAAGRPSSGTGVKTLLAKAVAGGRGVQFLSISGSTLWRCMWAGASRAGSVPAGQEERPAIIFIDDRRRGLSCGSGLGGGHDEREQTLNQLLGGNGRLRPNEGVVVPAATIEWIFWIRALLRPGRLTGRSMGRCRTHQGPGGDLQVHAKNKPLAEDVDLKQIGPWHRRLYRRRSGEPPQRGGPAGGRSSESFITTAKDLQESIIKVMPGRRSTAGSSPREGAAADGLSRGGTPW